MKVPFTKMTGLGNDYIYLDAISNEIPRDQILPLIPALSRRRFGIGSDGVIFIMPSDRANARMEMYNADGSRAEMCGNGIRCVARYVMERILNKTELDIETDAGVAKGSLLHDGNVRVEMFSSPKVSDRSEDVTASNQSFKFHRVDVGNPHAVIHHTGIDSIPLEEWGPQIENNLLLFPKRVNTEFFEEVSKGHVKMRVWERGSGETLACGTGAAAVAAVYRKSHPTNRVRVSLLGGDLYFEWIENAFFMTGPATFVADGVFDLKGWN